LPLSGTARPASVPRKRLFCGRYVVEESRTRLVGPGPSHHERGASICIAWHTTSAALGDLDPERFGVAADFENRKDALPDDERAAIEFGLKSVQSPTT